MFHLLSDLFFYLSLEKRRRGLAVLHDFPAWSGCISSVEGAGAIFNHHSEGQPC